MGKLAFGVLAFGLVVLLSSFVGAISISGTVYDSDLQPVNGAVVELSFPRQVIVAVNGSYAFEVEPGTYSITASKEIQGQEFKASENLTIGAQSVKFDLILLLPSDLNGADIADIAGTISGTEDTTSQPLEAPVPLWLFAVAIIIVIALAGLAFWKFQQEKPRVVERIIEKIVEKTPQIEMPKVELPQVEKPEMKMETAPGELNEFKRQILKILQNKGGAAEQKELRRELPWSEARMSIELTELEKMGKIKKIKRGRANLVKVV